MTVTASSFKAFYPEFDDAPDALVTSYITRAELMLDSNTWGDLYDQGVAAYVAAALARAPQSRSMQIESRGRGTIYDWELRNLMLRATVGYRVSRSSATDEEEYG